MLIASCCIILRFQVIYHKSRTFEISIAPPNCLPIIILQTIFVKCFIPKKNTLISIMTIMFLPSIQTPIVIVIIFLEKKNKKKSSKCLSILDLYLQNV